MAGFIRANCRILKALVQYVDRRLRVKSLCTLYKKFYNWRRDCWQLINRNWWRTVSNWQILRERMSVFSKFVAPSTLTSISAVDGLTSKDIWARKSCWLFMGSVMRWKCSQNMLNMVFVGWVFHSFVSEAVYVPLERVMTASAILLFFFCLSICLLCPIPIFLSLSYFVFVL